MQILNNMMRPLNVSHGKWNSIRTDPTPVSQLSKMYQNKGMVEEATAYHQVYTQIKRNQEVG